ncbi:MAG: hypothetical protein ACE5GX_18500, partial [Thermoanaerobaculia bacterium]
MSDSRDSIAVQVEELLARYIEEHVLHGATLDPLELCRERTELLEPLRGCILEYERLSHALQLRGENESRKMVPPADSTDGRTLSEVQTLGSGFPVSELLGRDGMGE